MQSMEGIISIFNIHDEILAIILECSEDTVRLFRILVGVSRLMANRLTKCLTYIVRISTSDYRILDMFPGLTMLAVNRNDTPNIKHGNFSISYFHPNIFNNLQHLEIPAECLEQLNRTSFSRMLDGKDELVYRMPKLKILSISRWGNSGMSDKYLNPKVIPAVEIITVTGFKMNIQDFNVSSLAIGLVFDIDVNILNKLNIKFLYLYNCSFASTPNSVSILNNPRVSSLKLNNISSTLDISNMNLVLLHVEHAGIIVSKLSHLTELFITSSFVSRSGDEDSRMIKELKIVRHTKSENDIKLIKNMGYL